MTRTVDTAKFAMAQAAAAAPDALRGLVASAAYPDRIGAPWVVEARQARVLVLAVLDLSVVLARLSGASWQDCAVFLGRSDPDDLESFYGPIVAGWAEWRPWSMSDDLTAIYRRVYDTEDAELLIQWLMRAVTWETVTVDSAGLLALVEPAPTE